MKQGGSITLYEDCQIWEYFLSKTGQSWKKICQTPQKSWDWNNDSSEIVFRSISDGGFRIMSCCTSINHIKLKKYNKVKGYNIRKRGKVKGFWGLLKGSVRASPHTYAHSQPNLMSLADWDRGQLSGSRQGGTVTAHQPEILLPGHILSFL